MGEILPVLNTIEDLTPTQCFKERKESKACKCETEDNAKFEYPATENKTDKKIKAKIAEENFEVIKKGLLNITNMVLDLKAYGHTKKIDECSLDYIRDLENQCRGKGLYQHLENTDYGIENSFTDLANKTKDEILSQSESFDQKAKFLYSRDKLEPETCDVPDTVINKIFQTYNTQKLFELVGGINPLDPNKSLESQFQEYSLNLDEDKKIQAFDYFRNIARSPYFKNAITEQPMPTWLSKRKLQSDTDIQEKIVNDLKVQCKKIVASAKETLCSDESENITPSYKNFRLAIKTEEDVINKSKLLKDYCVASSDPVVIKAKEIKEETLSFIPNHMKRGNAEDAAQRSFGETQHEVRNMICDSIPGQANIEETIKSCPDEDTTPKCEYLRIYKSIYDKEFEKQNPPAVLAELKHEDGTKFTEAEIKEEVEKRKKQFALDFDKIMGGIDKAANMTDLMSHFLGGYQPNNENYVIPSPQPNGTNTVSPKIGNNNTTNSNGGGNSNLNSNSIVKGSGPVKKAVAGGSNGSGNNTVVTNNDYDANAIANSYFDNINDYVAEREEINKEIARRIFKKKSSGNAFDATINNENKPRPKKISRRERKRRQEQYEEFRREYLDDRVSTRSARADEVEWDEEDLLEEQLFDQNFGNGKLREPARNIASTNTRGAVRGPGFYKDSVTGNIVKTPTVAMDAIPNSGFAGTGINTGDRELNELTQITLFGTLAEDLSSIDPNTVEVLDSNSSELVLKISELVKNKEPFVLKNQHDDSQKILVKFNEDGGFNLYVKDEASRRFKLATETDLQNPEYNAFYKNVQKAFNQNFMGKFAQNTY